MADEKVTYRIEVDDTDLGPQLDAIRQRIDSSIGATAMRMSELPQAQDLLANYPLLDKQFTSLPTEQFGQTLDNSFWNQVNLPQAGSHAADLTFLQSMSAQMDKAAESLQMGYTKFTDDLRVLGLLTRSAPYPTFTVPGGPGIPESHGFFKDLIAADMFPSFMGTLDSGFDYTGPVTPGENTRAARIRSEQRFKDLIGNYGFDAAGIAVGATIGSIFPVIGTATGAFTGWSIGSAIDLGADVLLSAERERKDIGRGLHGISRRVGAGITSNEAEDLAAQIQDMFIRPEQRARGFNVQSAEEEIVAFANAGGYSNVRGIEEFKSATMGLLNNFKQVASDLDMSFSEAAKFIGNLQQNMMANAENVTTLTARISNIASVIGMSPTELAGIGLQGAELVRGTGIGMEAGYMMALDSRLQAERLTRTGDDDIRRIIAEAGGADRFGIGQMETLVRWGLSGQGMLSLTAMMGGFNGAGGNVGMLSAAGEFIAGNPMVLPALSIQLPKIIGALGKEGTEELTLRAIQPYVDLAKDFPEAVDSEGKVYWDVIAGLISKDFGISADKAEGLVKGALNAGTGASRKELAARDAIRKLQNEADINTPIPWYRKLRYGVAYELDKVFDSEKINRFSNDVDDALERTLVDFSDFITGSRTYLTDNIIRDTETEKAFYDFENSAFYKNIKSKADSLANGKDLKSKEERDRILSRAARNEHNAFIELLDDPNLSNALSGRSIEIRGLDAKTIEIFEKGTVGVGFPEREQILEELVAMNNRQVPVDKMHIYLNDRLRREAPVNVDKGSKEFKDAVDFAWKNINPKVVGENDTPEIARNKLAQSGYGKNYLELNEIERAAFHNRVNDDSLLREATGGSGVSSVDYETSIRNQLLKEYAETVNTEAKADREAALREAQNISTDYSKMVREDYVTPNIFSKKMPTADFVKKEIDNIFEDMEKDYGRGDMYTENEMDKFINKYRGEGDLAKAAAWESVKYGMKKTGAFETTQQGLLMGARLKIQPAIDATMNNLRVQDIKDEGTRLAISKEIESTILRSSAGGEAIRLFGEISEDAVDSLSPGLTKMINTAESTDQKLKILRAKIAKDIGLQSVFESASPGLLSSLGIDTTIDSSIKTVMDSLKLLITEDGLKVLVSEEKIAGFSYLMPNFLKKGEE